MARKPMIQVPMDESATPKQRLDRFLSGLLTVGKEVSANLPIRHEVLVVERLPQGDPSPGATAAETEAIEQTQAIGDAAWSKARCPTDWNTQSLRLYLATLKQTTKIIGVDGKQKFGRSCRTIPISSIYWRHSSGSGTAATACCV